LNYLAYYLLIYLLAYLLSYLYALAYILVCYKCICRKKACIWQVIVCSTMLMYKNIRFYT